MSLCPACHGMLLSPQDMLRRQQDLLTLSDERRAALEANIAKAPDRRPVEMDLRYRYRPGLHGGISHLVVNSLFALFFRH